MTYQVRWTEPALELLGEIADQRIQRNLLAAADSAVAARAALVKSAELGSDPDKRGRPLTGNLTGYWSLHWSRYRIICLIDDEGETVFVVAAGIREEHKPRDIYQLAKKLLRRGLLEPPTE